MISIGDYRQLVDALFHAGTRSGSEFEHIDEDNGLHFYVIDIHRDEQGVLRYTVGALALSGGSSSNYGVKMSQGKAGKIAKGATMCSFELTNSGSAESGTDSDLAEYVQSDIYRLEAEVQGEGWQVQLPNALATAEFGKSTMAKVAVGAGEHAAAEATVLLTATSESDPETSITKQCLVKKA